MPVHGRWISRYSDCSPHVCGCGAFVPLVVAVQAGIRVAGIAGGWVWETGMGRTCHRLPLRPVLERVLVRCVCNTASPTGM